MEKKYASVYKSEKTRNELLKDYERVLRNWPIPFEERVLETASGRTHILTCGNRDGRSVMLFHGVGNNSLMWRYNVEGLGKRFRLHLVDTINDPGKSEAAMSFNPETGYTPWIREVLDALGIPKALLVGHSKGGWIVLNSAICAAERVEKIVLLAPAVGINSALSPAFMAKSLRIGLFPSKKAVESYMKYVSGPEARINPGHALQGEKPEEVNGLISDFLLG